MRKTLTVPLALFTLALLAGSVMAQTDSKVRFGIRPTEAVEDRPETFSYFSYEASPGEVISDAAFILNTGFVPVSLHLYAADGFTAVNTGTAFTLKGQDAVGYSRGTRQWLSLSATDFRLEGAEDVTVPFTVTVPPDALPGHHVAGLVVEAPPDENSSVGEAGGQFAAIVVQQSAVAVVIDVPGAHVAGLEIISTCMKTQGDLGATFVVGVHNTGNILLKAEGALSLMDRDGVELASVPLEMGTVLPGDITTFQVDHPIRLGDGEYLFSDVLNYEGKTATFGETEFKVKDGQPEVGCDPEEDAEPPASFIEIVSPLRGGGSSLVWIAISGGAALALVLIILALIRRRRARGAGPEEPPSPPVPPSSSTGGSDETPGEAPLPKTGERTSERPSITKRILALIPRRKAGASEPEQPSTPVPPSSSTDASDETPGEAQPTKVPERTSERPSFTSRILALIPRRKAGASGPEQPSSPVPPSISTDGSDEALGEAPLPKTGERTSKRSSITKFVSALLPRRRAGASGPEQPSDSVSPSSSTDGLDGTPGEAQPTKAPEGTSERSSITKFMSALIPRRRAGASEPEQPSAPMPSFSSIGGSDGTPGKAQPQDGDPPSEAKMPSPPAFAPPARPAKSNQHPEAERPSRPNVTPPPQPARDEADLPVFLKEQLQHRTRPAERPAAGEHRGSALGQETDPEEHHEEKRAA